MIPDSKIDREYVKWVTTSSLDYYLIAQSEETGLTQDFQGPYPTEFAANIAMGVARSAKLDGIIFWVEPRLKKRVDIQT